MNRDTLIKYLDGYLKISEFQDYGPLGLQVEGKKRVRKVAVAVSASVELFERARERGADLVIVHHGIFWDRESRVLKGGLKERIRLLLDGDISLLAYHLPLDKHPRVGNNAVAARKLGLKKATGLGEIGIQGEVAAITLPSFLKRVKALYSSDPLIFSFGPAKIKRIGICSGAAQGEITEAITAGLDAYLTGEVSEQTMHLAKEGKIHFIAAGHYATEKLGIRALGDHIARKFNLKVEFIDIPNPV